MFLPVRDMFHTRTKQFKDVLFSNNIGGGGGGNNNNNNKIIT
jgi:hypothetical protein